MFENRPSPDIVALRRRLKELIIEVCDLSELSVDDIADDERLIRGDRPDLDLTSLDAVELAAAIEDEFHVRITNLSVANAVFRSVATLADFLAAEQGRAR